MSAETRRYSLHAMAMLVFTLCAPVAAAQTLHFERLAPELLGVSPPSMRVTGAPGRMEVREAACRDFPLPAIRQRIVDIAIQEWAFFGFPVVDQTALDDDSAPPPEQRRRRPWLGAGESARVADSIAGYWASTAEGAWILERQNREWNGPDGIGARWRDPWSAAFISWVMCEAGLAESRRFRRAIAHHSYIDQAIQARDGAAAEAAYLAHDVGETGIEPGDLVCSARRPRYGTLAERRSDLGSGIRSHCDIVVEVDAERARVLAIGGNVRGAVSLKLLPAEFEGTGDARTVRAIGRGRRAVFAHLSLRAPRLAQPAFDSSPTIQALGGTPGALEWLEQRLAGDAAGTLTTAQNR